MQCKREQVTSKNIYEQNLADKILAASRKSCLKAIKLSYKSGKKDLLPVCISSRLLLILEKY